MCNLRAGCCAPKTTARYKLNPALPDESNPHIFLRCEHKQFRRIGGLWRLATLMPSGSPSLLLTEQITSQGMFQTVIMLQKNFGTDLIRNSRRWCTIRRHPSKSQSTGAQSKKHYIHRAVCCLCVLLGSLRAFPHGCDNSTTISILHFQPRPTIAIRSVTPYCIIRENYRVDLCHDMLGLSWTITFL